MLSLILLAVMPCNASLWNHVYNKPRLQVIQPCSVITGKVQEARTEKDGDLHTLLKLDKQFESMLNPMNFKHQLGNLVVEPICVSNPKQQDTIDAGVCANFNQQPFKALLKPGNCVEVTGAFVKDTEHGHNEIHPVTRVRVIPCGN